MFYFLPLLIILGLAFPGILILFAPAGLVLIGAIRGWGMRNRNQPKLQPPKLSLEAKIWKYLRFRFSDIEGWDWAVPDEKEQFVQNKKADIVIRFQDGAVIPYVLFEKDDRYGIMNKPEDFTGVNTIRFTVVPNSIDPPVNPDPIPQSDPADPDDFVEDNTVDEPAPEPHIHHGRPEPMPIDYSMLAFEWVTAHVSDISEQLSIAMDVGESECLLGASLLPKKEAWDCVAKELEVACDLNAEVTELGIVISQKDQDVKAS